MFTKATGCSYVQEGPKSNIFNWTAFLGGGRSYANKSLTVEQGMAATEPESRVSSTSGMLHIIDTEALLVCS